MNGVCICMWDERIRHYSFRRFLHKTETFCINCVVCEKWLWGCRDSHPQFSGSSLGTPGTFGAKTTHLATKYDEERLAFKTRAFQRKLKPKVNFISSLFPFRVCWFFQLIFWTTCQIRKKGKRRKIFVMFLFAELLIWECSWTMTWQLIFCLTYTSTTNISLQQIKWTRNKTRPS